MKERRKRLKLGIVANEFFDEAVGRFGGFGWATRQVARLFKDNPELGVEVVFLSREFKADAANKEQEVHGIRLIPLMSSRVAYWRSIWSERIDLLLAIDYRPSYDELFQGLPRTPIIIWVRDPRTSEDASRLLTVRVPGQERVIPKTVKSFKCGSIAKVMRWSRLFHRPVLFATPARYLAHKVPGTYGVQPNEVSILPNIIDLQPGKIRKSEKPSVLFLGRLDPYKRPWIVTALAEDFPEVDFFLCGKPHVTGPGGWEPKNLPANTHFLGHVDGEKKLQLLSSAWVLINTSMHEGLAVSFQEALRCETPIISSVDPQGVVTAYGIYTGYWEGTGLEALPQFRAGLRELLDNEPLRTRLGREGRTWVQATHTPEKFLAAFADLCSKANVASKPAVTELSRDMQGVGSVPGRSV